MAFDFSFIRQRVCDKIPIVSEENMANDIYDGISIERTVKLLLASSSCTIIKEQQQVQKILVLIAYASDKDSGEPVHTRSLIRAFTARAHKVETTMTALKPKFWHLASLGRYAYMLKE